MTPCDSPLSCGSEIKLVYALIVVVGAYSPKLNQVQVPSDEIYPTHPIMEQRLSVTSKIGQREPTGHGHQLMKF